MLLTVKNIGGFHEATIKLNGITVIAGENNTGKTTIGKSLFCVFNSSYKINEQIQSERKNLLQKIFLNADANTFTPTDFFESNAMEYILNDTENNFKNNDKSISDYLTSLLLKNKSINEKISNQQETFHTSIDAIAKKVRESLNIPDDDIYKIILERKISNEFDDQISNIYYNNEPGIINLKIKDKNLRFSVFNNKVIEISNTFSLNTEAIYIDDPFVLDNLNSFDLFLSNFFQNSMSSSIEHRQHLRKKLIKKKEETNIISEILTKNKLKIIAEKINGVCTGDFITDKKVYRMNKSDFALKIKNISSGLKTFIIIKTLLLNGSLEENGTIILDEPEVHLHPKWQIFFAELIVLLQKELNMHILINTHSPYFLNAIEVYANKHQINTKCNYYLAQNVDSKSEIIDISHNVEEIYKKLAEPFQTLENEKYSYDR